MFYPEQSACQLRAERRMLHKPAILAAIAGFLYCREQDRGASAASAWCVRRHACTTSSLMTCMDEFEGSE